MKVVNFDEYDTAGITSIVPSVGTPNKFPNTLRVAGAVDEEKQEELTTGTAGASEHKPKTKLEDFVVGEVPEKPWQHEKYSPHRS